MGTWAVGPNGSAQYWDGLGWTAATTGTSNSLNGLDLQGSSLWAVGDDGEWLTSSGTTWQRLGATADIDWSGIAGTVPSLNVFGTQGHISTRSADGHWSAVSTGVNFGFGVACDTPDAGSIVTGNYVVYRYDQQQLTLLGVPDAGGTIENFVCSPNGSVYALTWTGLDHVVSRMSSVINPAWTRVSPAGTGSYTGVCGVPGSDNLWLLGGLPASNVTGNVSYVWQLDPALNVVQTSFLGRQPFELWPARWRQARSTSTSTTGTWSPMASITSIRTGATRSPAQAGRTWSAWP